MNNSNAIAKECKLIDLTKEIDDIISSSLKIAQETEEFLFGQQAPGICVKAPSEEPYNFQEKLELLSHKAIALNSLLQNISQRLY